MSSNSLSSRLRAGPVLLGNTPNLHGLGLAVSSGAPTVSATAAAGSGVSSAAAGASEGHAGAESAGGTNLPPSESCGSCARSASAADVSSGPTASKRSHKSLESKEASTKLPPPNRKHRPALPDVPPPSRAHSPSPSPSPSRSPGVSPSPSYTIPSSAGGAALRSAASTQQQLQSYGFVSNDRQLRPTAVGLLSPLSPLSPEARSARRKARSPGPGFQAADQHLGHKTTARRPPMTQPFPFPNTQPLSNTRSAAADSGARAISTNSALHLTHSGVDDVEVASRGPTMSVKIGCKHTRVFRSGAGRLALSMRDLFEGAGFDEKAAKSRVDNLLERKCQPGEELDGLIFKDNGVDMAYLGSALKILQHYETSCQGITREKFPLLGEVILQLTHKVSSDDFERKAAGAPHRLGASVPSGPARGGDPRHQPGGIGNDARTSLPEKPPASLDDEDPKPQSSK